MTDQAKRNEMLALIVVSVLLILTAWGNALAMFAVATIALLATLLWSKPSLRPLLSVAAACAIAVVIATRLAG